MKNKNIPRFILHILRQPKNTESGKIYTSSIVISEITMGFISTHHLLYIVLFLIITAKSITKAASIAPEETKMEGTDISSILSVSFIARSGYPASKRYLYVNCGTQYTAWTISHPVLAAKEVKKNALPDLGEVSSNRLDTTYRPGR